MTWFWNLLVPEKPTGWFRAIGKSGSDQGLGYECPDCHALVRYGVQPGGGVRHCNRVDVAPTSVKELPTRSLVGAGHSLPPNVIPVGFGFDD